MRQVPHGVLVLDVSPPEPEWIRMATWKCTPVTSDSHGHHFPSLPFCRVSGTEGFHQDLPTGHYCLVPRPEEGAIQSQCFLLPLLPSRVLLALHTAHPALSGLAARARVACQAPRLQSRPPERGRMGWLLTGLQGAPNPGPIGHKHLLASEGLTSPHTEAPIRNVLQPPVWSSGDRQDRLSEGLQERVVLGPEQVPGMLGHSLS